MSLYCYAPGKGTWDWRTLPKPGIFPLSDDTQLGTADALFIHKSDLECIDQDDPLHALILAQNKDKHCAEMVFFSGGGCSYECSEYVQDLKDNGLNCAEIGIDVFGIIESVKAVAFFSEIVQAKAKNPDLKISDILSAQSRELKTVFRLLVQAWLVASDETGDTLEWFSDNRMRQHLKEHIQAITQLDYWRPVSGGITGDSDAVPLNSKLKNWLVKHDHDASFLFGMYPEHLNELKRERVRALNWAFCNNG
jgi:hypothetical protein